MTACRIHQGVLALMPTSMLLLGLSACLSHGAEVTYTVEGRLHYETVGARPKEYVRDESFRVSVSNCLWSITAVCAADGGASYKAVYDGSVVTSSVHLPAPPKEIKESKDFLGNDSVLGIETDDTPNCLAPGMGQIWLAFASACKYSTGTTGMMELVWFSDIKLRRNRFTTPASWENISEPPFLPKAVTFFFDSDLYYGALDKPLPSPKTHGLCASYRATAYTNFGRATLPLRFDYEGYEAASGNRTQPRLVYRYHGELVDAYHGTPSGAFDHGFGSRTLVEDSRYATLSNPVPIVHYLVTDRAVPSMDSPQMVRNYIRASQAQVYDVPTTKKRDLNRLVLLATLAGLALLLFVFLLKRW